MNVTSVECRVTRGQKAAGYDLAGCIILAATVIGTPEAKEAAMDLLPVARKVQGREEAARMATQADRVKAWIAEATAPVPSGKEILRWAKARKAAGVAYVGVTKVPERPWQRRGILQALREDGVLSMKQLQQATGRSIQRTWQELNGLLASGQVVRTGTRTRYLYALAKEAA